MGEYKILVTGPSWIGDMVMAQSLFILLKKMRPYCRIDVLAPPATAAVVGRMPEVSRCIPFNSRHGKLDLLMRIKTGLALKTAHYDEAIIIPKTLKAALPSMFAGIPKRAGFRSHFGMVNRVRSYSKSRDDLFIKRYLSLSSDTAYDMEFEDIPKPQLQIDCQNKDVLLTKYGLKPDEFVVFAPGAEFGPAKKWPSEYFAELADLLNNRRLKICIVGSDKDKKTSSEIIENSKHPEIVNLCGLTKLPDAIDIISAANAVFTNDSGLMHISTACDTQVFAIFGSTSSRYTPPISRPGLSKVIQSGLSCSPCFDRECRYGHYDCLRQISPLHVFKEYASTFDH